MTRRGIPPPEHGRELGPPAVPAACPDACRHEIARPAFRFAKGRLPKICYELGYELRFQILRIGLRSLSPRDQKLITACQLPDVPSSPMADRFAGAMSPVLLEPLPQASSTA